MKSAWLIRPFPHNINRIREFLEKGIIAVGWPEIGDLSGKSKEELKELLSGEPYNYKATSLGNVVATLNIVVNKMKVGDLVLVANESEMHIGEITSDYHYVEKLDNTDDGYPHQRKVEWLSNTTREDLSSALRSSLRVPKTSADLSRHLEEIEALSRGMQPSEPEAENDLIALEYQLRPDLALTFEVPANITKTEAERLGDFFKTIYFE